MTREEYRKLMEFIHNDAYKGKHEMKTYTVWRVLGPAGPEQTLYVDGLNQAREAVRGCWDWVVTDPEGVEITSKVILYS